MATKKKLKLWTGGPFFLCAFCAADDYRTGQLDCAAAWWRPAGGFSDRDSSTVDGCACLAGGDVYGDHCHPTGDLATK